MDFWNETHHFASYLLLNNENERGERKEKECSIMPFKQRAASMSRSAER